MGISLSKRVTHTLTTSPLFNSTCNSTFHHFLSLSGGSHILPYQLFHASTHLHVSLLPSLTLLATWAPSSPTRAQVDHAYRAQEAQARAQEAQARAQEAQVRAQEAQVRAQEARSQAQDVLVRAQKAHFPEGLAHVRAQEAQARAQEALTQAQETHVSEDLAQAQVAQTQESLDQAHKILVQAQDQAQESLTQAQVQEGLNQDLAQESLAQEGLAQEGLAQKCVGQAQEGLGRDEFKEFAVVLLSEMIVSGAKAKVVGMVPIGVVGIGGVGLVSRLDKNLVGSAIGVYALAVATWIYVGLG